MVSRFLVRLVHNGQRQQLMKSGRAAALFSQMTKIIERKDKIGLERFLAEIEHDQELSKSERYDLKIQASCLTFNPMAIQLTLQDMHNNGVKPGKIALRALIQYHVTAGDLEGAEKLCMSLPKYGESSLDAYMTCTMISGWGKHGMVERAESLYQRCPELHNSVFLVTAMMSVYYEAKQYAKALQLFDTLTVVKPDSVMRKLQARCLYQSGSHAAAIVEWRKIQTNLHPHHWMDMARMFVAAHPEVVVGMAKEAASLFGVQKGVPDLVALAIRKACQSEEEVKALYTAISHLPIQSKESLLSSALVAIADRLVDLPTLRQFVKEQMELIKDIPPLSRLTIQSKLT